MVNLMMYRAKLPGLKGALRTMLGHQGSELHHDLVGINLAKLGLIRYQSDPLLYTINKHINDMSTAATSHLTRHIFSNILIQCLVSRHTANPAIS
jgi:hypothetical protein